MTPEQSFTLRAKPLAWRAFFSLALYFLYAFINNLLNPLATLAAGKAAGGQFAPDDVSYVTSTYGLKFAPQLGLPFIAFLAVLAVIWWKPAKMLAQIVFAASLAAMLTLPVSPAGAYYDKTNYPEIYWIAPNESAFFIPDVGDNKTDQAKFGSEAYYEANKIAAKRFEIPHVKLAGSSYTWDFYVPAGRLIVVDRAPYAREWKHAGNGTGDGNEALQCQSSQGHDVTVEISIAASVFEKDAPRFLYRFGIRPIKGDRNDPVIKWQSVFEGKSLAEVMDTVVKGNLQSRLCKFFSVRTVDVINAEADTIITEAEKDLRKYLIEEFGITLDYIGWGSTFDYSPTVQKALDDKFAADKIASVLPILERQAQLKIQEGLGEGLKAHGLPKNLVAIPSNLMDFTKWFTSPTTPGATFVPNAPAPAPRQ